ncbi:MAG: peptidase T, partial [Paraprevotella sp.]|nr:peptidase T [Paraprevotella sp.]
MDLVQRFLKYVGFDTQSSEEGTGCPSTEKQMVFARYLEKELKEIGLQDV